MKIYLIDNGLDLNPKNNLGGHNYIYRKTLSKIEGTEIMDKKEIFVTSREKFFLAIKQKKEYLRTVPNNSIAHLLQLDIFYTSPSAIKMLNHKGIKVIGTLHWYPKSITKKILLRYSASFMDKIIVHSEFIKNQLCSIGIKNVEVVDYPVFYEKSKISSSNNKSNKIKVTCLGGTRYDKGLDILMNAFEYIDKEVKNKIEFILVGKEKDIKYDDIRRKANQYKISVNIDSRIVSEDEYWEYVNDTDVILLPYRKIFTGNSGPMTDGIYLDKYIIGPDAGNLGYLIKKHDLGSTFIQEDSKDLAKKINLLPNINLNKVHEYKKKLEVENFLIKYKEIYRSVIRS